MYKIGLTGGIASGKSTVLGWLKMKGVTFWDADQVARAVVAPNSKGLMALASHFGKEILQEDGTLNRARLGEIIFSSPEKKEELDSILHPIILERLEEDTKKAEEAGIKAMIYDIPLLFETGWDTLMDEVWLVDTSPSVQLNRLMSRDGYSKNDAKLRVLSQMPVAEKRKKATYRIRNSSSKKALKKNLNALWNEKAALFV